MVQLANWVPESVRKKIQEMEHQGVFSHSLPQVHCFPGEKPFGTIVLWVGPGEFRPSETVAEIYQYYPEDLSYYKGLRGYSDLAARLALFSKTLWNRDMRYWVEGQKVRPSEAKLRMQEQWKKTFTEWLGAVAEAYAGAQSPSRPPSEEMGSLMRRGLRKKEPVKAPSESKAAEEVLELETPLETQSRLTRESHPELHQRGTGKRGTDGRGLPKTTRTQQPLKTLGYDKPRPKKGYFTRRKPPLESPLEFLQGLSNPEKHHFWPKYLKGLVSQTTKKLPRSLHKRLHEALDRWNRGLFRRKKTKPFFETMDPNEIIAELRKFYSEAEGGIFREFTPDFERAVEETLASMGK